LKRGLVPERRLDRLPFLRFSNTHGLFSFTLVPFSHVFSLLYVQSVSIFVLVFSLGIICEVPPADTSNKHVYITLGKILNGPYLYALEGAHLCPIECEPARGDRLSRLECDRVRQRARKFFHFFFLINGQTGVREMTKAMFQNSLPMIKIYSLRYVYYTFTTLAVNFGT